MTTLNETIAILDDLIAFPTVSADSNLTMICYLADRLRTVGARVDLWHNTSGTKANLFATFGPEGDNGVVLSGHSDVVPVTDQTWVSNPFKLRQDNDRLFGRGTCDMKGFIAACTAMAPRFAAARLTRPVHLCFTYDEETGCLGAQHLVSELQARNISPALAIIGEPTDMRLIEGHKGCYEYTTRFKGLEGHGSAPDAGVNAAEYAARFVARLLELRDALKRRAAGHRRFDPPWTTINIGRIAGGVAHNVIAGRAQVDWEMRPINPADADFVKTALHRYVHHQLLPAMQAVDPNASIETEVIAEVCGLTPTDKNAARDLVMELTGANTADLVPFGTEAGLFQGLGMDVVVYGPGSITQAHKPDEFVTLDQLASCLDMLSRLADHCDLPPQPVPTVR